MQFSMQEYWSGLPFPLQRLFLTQGLNPYLLHWQADSLPLSHLGSPTASPYSLGNHIHPPLESTITWRRWLLWLKLFIFSPNLSRSLPRCPVETSQQVQKTSSSKPLGSATTTIIAWIQTLHHGLIFLSPLPPLFYCTPPWCSILAPWFHDGWDLCLPYHPPLLLGALPGILWLPGTCTLPCPSPGSEVTHIEWAHKASWATWMPNQDPNWATERWFMVEGSVRMKL